MATTPTTAKVITAAPAKTIGRGCAGREERGEGVGRGRSRVTKDAALEKAASGRACLGVHLAQPKNLSKQVLAPNAHAVSIQCVYCIRVLLYLYTGPMYVVDINRNVTSSDVLA